MRTSSYKLLGACLAVEMQKWMSAALLCTYLSQKKRSSISIKFLDTLSKIPDKQYFLKWYTTHVQVTLNKSMTDSVSYPHYRWYTKKRLFKERHSFLDSLTLLDLVMTFLISVKGLSCGGVRPTRPSVGEEFISLFCINVHHFSIHNSW